MIIRSDTNLAESPCSHWCTAWRVGSVNQGEADCCHIHLEPEPKATLELLRALYLKSTLSVILNEIIERGTSLA